MNTTRKIAMGKAPLWFNTLDDFPSSPHVMLRLQRTTRSPSAALKALTASLARAGGDELVWAFDTLTFKDARTIELSGAEGPPGDDWRCLDAFAGAIQLFHRSFPVFAVICGEPALARLDDDGLRRVSLERSESPPMGRAEVWATARRLFKASQHDELLSLLCSGGEVAQSATASVRDLLESALCKGDAAFRAVLLAIEHRKLWELVRPLINAAGARYAEALGQALVEGADSGTPKRRRLFQRMVGEMTKKPVRFGRGSTEGVHMVLAFYFFQRGDFRESLHQIDEYGRIMSGYDQKLRRAYAAQTEVMKRLRDRLPKSRAPGSARRHLTCDSP